MAKKKYGKTTTAATASPKRSRSAGSKRTAGSKSRSKTKGR